MFFKKKRCFCDLYQKKVYFCKPIFRNGESYLKG